MIPVLCTHVKALSLPRLEDALLADDWSTGCLVWDYWRSHNVREFVADPWHWDTPPDPSKSRTVCGRRQVSMVMPVPPQPMCPPETRVTVNYDVGLAQDEHGKDVLHVKSSAVSHDVPRQKQSKIIKNQCARVCTCLFGIGSTMCIENTVGVFHCLRVYSKPPCLLNFVDRRFVLDHVGSIWCFSRGQPNPTKKMMMSEICDEYWMLTPSPSSMFLQPSCISLNWSAIFALYFDARTRYSTWVL